MNATEIKQEVWETVKDLNALWTTGGKPEELINYFHKDIVAITPSERKRLEGQDACVAGWKAFADAATTHYFNETDPDIRLFGDGGFAIVTYYFDMSFDMGGRNIKMKGRDMLSLVKEDGKWWVVADQFSPCPQLSV
jgi:hypothetical protein